MHILIAEKIRENPDLLKIVRNNIERWKPSMCVNTLPYIERWESLFDKGVESLLTFATSDSEDARTMRQASPFAGVLSPQERWKFLKDWSASHDT
jgi:hypothetical protein